MAERIVVLDPAGVRPGMADPYGRIVKSAELLVNEAAHIAVLSVQFEDGSLGAYSYPLGHGWTPAP